jgi:hypothetical protein
MDLCSPSTADATMDLSGDDAVMSIYDLPEYAIRGIIDYIPKTSRALLALALTTDSSLWREIHWCNSSPKSILTWFKKKDKKEGGSSNSKRPSAITKIILSAKNAEEENLWDEIDLSDISEEYAEGWCICPVKCEQISVRSMRMVGVCVSTFDCCFDVPPLRTKLTDDDIAGMLACINAVHKLKRFYLGNCFPLLSGTALEPLRGSTFLEQLDLSPNIGDEDGIRWCKISQTAVIPILNSIIERQNHRLKHLQFPREWRKNVESDDNGREMRLVGVGSGYFEEFLEKYNATEYQLGIHCKKCGVNCHESLSPVREDARFDGIQHFTCYDCLSHYCYNCKDEVENDFLLKFCDECEKWRCRDCEPMVSCHCCTEEEEDFVRRNGSYLCQVCTLGMTCDNCYNVFCQGCNDNGVLKLCKGCYKRGCYDCMAILSCEHDGCDISLCFDCRRQEGGVEDTLDTCENCFRSFCFKHRYEYVKENCRTLIANGCLECFRMVSTMLALPGVMEPSLLQG